MCALPTKGHHVVLAVGIERNVAHEHDRSVALDFLEHAVENVGGIFAVALVELLEGLHDPFRRVDQALAGRIVSGPEEQGLDGGFGVFAAGPCDRRELRGARLAAGVDDGIHGCDLLVVDHFTQIYGSARCPDHRIWGFSPTRGRGPDWTSCHDHRFRLYNETSAFRQGRAATVFHDGPFDECGPAIRRERGCGRRGRDFHDRRRLQQADPGTRPRHSAHRTASPPRRPPPRAIRACAARRSRSISSSTATGSSTTPTRSRPARSASPPPRSSPAT